MAAFANAILGICTAGEQAYWPWVVAAGWVAIWAVGALVGVLTAARRSERRAAPYKEAAAGEVALAASTPRGQFDSGKPEGRVYAAPYA